MFVFLQFFRKLNRCSYEVGMTCEKIRKVLGWWEDKIGNQVDKGVGWTFQDL